MGHLSRDQTIALLGKLSTDDQFRTLFQNDPRAGLRQLGVPEEQVADCSYSKLSPLQLARKEQFASARKQIIESQRGEFLAQIWPMHELTFGDGYLATAA